MTDPHLALVGEHLLLDEGVRVDPVKITEILAAGVATVAGVRESLVGAPPEWVASFEAGDATGFTVAGSPIHPA